MRGQNFSGIQIDKLLLKGNQALQHTIKLMKDGIKKGVVQPLPMKIFDMKDAEAAFRYMSQGKHVGKLLLKVS